VVLEVNLDNFIGQPEHDSMTSAHPFLDVNDICYVFLLRSLTFYRLSWFRFLAAFKITSEMLEQSHLFLKFFWVVCEIVLFAEILPIRCPPLHVAEVVTVWIKSDLSAVIEEDASCIVGQKVA